MNARRAAGRNGSRSHTALRRPAEPQAAAPALLLGAAVLLATGCAKKGLPGGGPPDLEPPRVIAAAPDSGAASVPRDARFSLTFSESMEPRSTADAVAIAPVVPIKQRRWSGRTLTVVPAESLQAGRSYVLFVGGTARDRHGNPMTSGASIAFTTADTFPPGVIAGRVVGRGISPTGAYVWCYPGGHEPDSTARDFDALALAGDDGDYRVVGLQVPGTYRLYAFVDVNRNRSFEPESDLLIPADTTLALTPEDPRIDGYELVVLNPRAPGRVSGGVIDSLGGEGTLRLFAGNLREPSRSVEVQCNDEGRFQVDLAPGPWRLRAYRDFNRDGRWEPASEPASDPLPIEVPPAGEVPDLRLGLKPPGEATQGKPEGKP